jgi:hypothetical protein
MVSRQAANNAKFVNNPDPSVRNPRVLKTLQFCEGSATKGYNCLYFAFSAQNGRPKPSGRASSAPTKITHRSAADKANLSKFSLLSWHECCELAKKNAYFSSAANLSRDYGRSVSVIVLCISQCGTRNSWTPKV